MKPNPQKIKAVKEFPWPRSSKNIKQFLGLAGYYRHFYTKFFKNRETFNFLKKDEKFI